ncbi:MAG: helix-turn-helix transcriptional regulator [Thiomicrospira sp.]|jgi:transcriptional regulator with XRE-family HTH domain|nr:helix-turn-helix transcriptional regulator [Thiomicrospira sp.]
MNASDIAQLLKLRREQLKLEQKDMRELIGMSQQQYSKAESSGEITLKTLLRILDGLDLELALIPKENAIPMNALQVKTSFKKRLEALADD